MIDFWKIKKSKDKFHEKVNENLRDRVRREATNTLRIIRKLKIKKGLTDKEIFEDVSKSKL